MSSDLEVQSNTRRHASLEQECAPCFGAYQVAIPPLTGIYTEPMSVKKSFRLLGFFGPAAVVASLSIGAGETIMVTGLGAWSEYGLLWLLLLSVLVKGVFVTYLIGRYTAITGDRVVHRLTRLPGPRGWLLFIILLAEIAVVSMSLAAVGKPCGSLLTSLLFEHFPVGMSFDTCVNVWTTLLIGAALVLSLFSSYAAIERQQIVLCGLMVAGTILAIVVVSPDVLRLVQGGLSIGSLPTPPEWAPEAARNAYFLNLVTIFSFVGGGLSGYLAYSSWVGIHGWGINSHPEIKTIRSRAGFASIDYLPEDPVQVRRLKTLLMPLRWDVGMGATVLAIVTTSFLAAGATVLYPLQQPVSGDAWDLLTKQAAIWRQVSAVLVPVYYVCVLAALWGTLASIPEAITRVTHEFLGAVWPLLEHLPVRRLQMVLCGGFFLTSVVWTWSGMTFDLLTQLTGLIALGVGITTVYICVLYFNVTLPRAYRPHWLMVGASSLAAVVLAVCAVGSAIGLIQRV
jgi:Mn2+/Fe2+ NRAMP family transporter